MSSEEGAGISTVTGVVNLGWGLSHVMVLPPHPMDVALGALLVYSSQHAAIISCLSTI